MVGRGGEEEEEREKRDKMMHRERAQSGRTYGLPVRGGELQNEGLHVHHEDLVVEVDDGVVPPLRHVHTPEHLQEEGRPASL